MWDAVIENVGPDICVGRYGRAGLVWSDPARGPRDPNAQLSDLSMLLDHLGNDSDAILVGHSLSGPK